MIFTILVSRDNALFASKAKNQRFLKKFQMEHSRRVQRSEKKFQKTLILVFEEIGQFWSHFHGTMHGLPQRLKSTFLKKISNGVAPKGPSE